jgi:acyl-CoA dehydrogenase
MDFATPASTAELCARVRTFVDEDLIPLEPVFLGEGWGAVLPALEAARARVKALGLWAPQLPRELGGLGLPLLDFGLVGRELGRSLLGHFTFNCQAPDAGNLEILHSHGTPEQQDRWLGPLAAGQLRSCFAMTEPELAGSNPVWMGTTARRDGDSFVIDGHKWFTSSADGAAFAVVMAVTDPAAPPHRRATMLIVPMDTPGVEFVRNVPVMGHAGEGWASHAELRFVGCRVPAANVLGGLGNGFAMAQERLGPGRIHHCMRWLGICDRAIELLCRRAIERELAPGEPLAGKQIVQAWIADSKADVETAALLVLRAAWTIDAHGVKAARDQVSLIKLVVARALGRVLDRAVQAHGALGVTDDTPLAYMWRSERAARIYDGPDEVHQAVVARQVLRSFGFDTREAAPRPAAAEVPA